jgi:hypothetical protein
VGDEGAEVTAGAADVAQEAPVGWLADALGRRLGRHAPS